MGRSTCASASALSLEAQPEHVERVVRRILRSEGVSAFAIFIYLPRIIIRGEDYTSFATDYSFYVVLYGLSGDSVVGVT